MKKFVITTDNLKALVNELAGMFDVFSPKRENENTVSFGKISSFDEYVPDILITNTTAKDKVYLQSEKLYEYELKKDTVDFREAPAGKEAVIFGCRPCDARGFDVIDKLFGWTGYDDSSYKSGRKNTTIISVSCAKPESTCFCTSFKEGSPTSAKGSDILLTQLGDKYLAEIITDRGAALAAKYPSYFSAVADADSAAKDEFTKASEAKIPKKLDMVAIKKNLDAAFDSNYWDTVHLPCVKCGACTFVCPTCYCFDITEKKFSYLNGERTRTWDTCMSEMFTKMAGGHNPRTDTKRRFRQRFMHKFRYHVDNFQEELCTGCGRCIKQCPVGIDIRKVIEEAK